MDRERVGWLLSGLVLFLVLGFVVRLVVNRESVWHLSESVPLEPVEVALPDGGDWPRWKVAIEAVAGATPDVVALGKVLKESPGALQPEVVRPLMPPDGVLDALPDPRGSIGFRVPARPGNGPDELPRGALTPGRAWVARAWLRHAEDPAGAQVDLRRAYRYGVLMQHSGDNPVASITGVMTQLFVLKEVSELRQIAASGGPWPALREAVVWSQSLGPGIGPGIRTLCLHREERFRTFNPGGQTPGPLGIPRRFLPNLNYSADKSIAFVRAQCRVQLANLQRRPDEREPLPSLPDDRLGEFDNYLGRLLLDVGGGNPETFTLRVDQLREARAAFLQADDQEGTGASPDRVGASPASNSQ